MLMVYVALIMVFCNTAFVQCMEGDWPLQQSDTNESLQGNGTNQSVEFQPIYNPYAPALEKKPLLHINSLIKSDTVRMKQLCDQVDVLMRSYTGKSIISYKEPASQFMSCIESCNKARDYGIDEDLLGKFSFEKEIRSGVTFFFSCLKYYNNNPDESAATDFEHSSLSPLAHSIHYAYNVSEREFVISKSLKLFIDDITKIEKKDHPWMYINKLVQFLYSDKKEDQQNNHFVVLDAKEWKHTFCCDVWRFLYWCDENSGVTFDRMWVLNALIANIDATKKRRTITNEYGLGCDILHYEPSVMETILCGDTYSLRSKQRASLFCAFVERYNHARATKITPTRDSMLPYVIGKKWHIAYPDKFDQSLVDHNKYALGEFEQLTQDITNLVVASDENVAKCVAIAYPQVKIF